jgi:hypothetical protein
MTIKATTDAQKQEIKTALTHATRPGSVEPLGGKRPFGGQPAHDLRSSYSAVTHAGYEISVMVYDEEVIIGWPKSAGHGSGSPALDRVYCTCTSINQMVFDLIDTK